MYIRIRTYKSRIVLYCTDHLRQHIFCNITRTQDHRNFFTQIDDRRLNADTYGSAIQDHRNLAVEILIDMFRQCRAWSAGCIRARCSDITATFTDQRQCSRMGWHTDSHRIQSTGGLIWHRFAFPEDHGQRSRPKCICQCLCLRRNIRSDLIQRLKFSNMYNQWIVRRTPFCCINSFRPFRQ